MFTRRHVVAGLPLLASTPAFTAPDRFAPLRRAIGGIEQAAGGPIGVALLDSSTGARFMHRADQRFPLCSTFKLLLAARMLHGAQAGNWRATDRFPIERADILANSPFSETRVGDSASLMELAEAIVSLSDNTAANIGLARIGGPAALTTWLRGLGDTVTRLDRMEPELNNENPDDPRDTTTPAAMLSTCRRLLTGAPLSTANRKDLMGWMVASRTADTMIRAGLPAGWKEANKTGAGEFRARNIVSVITPPGRQPIWVAAYLLAAKSTLAERNKHFVPLGKAIAQSLA
jgi:beta-lactamase class A